MENIPQDFESEQAVLGSIIYNNSNLDAIDGIITPESFYKPAHQHILRACLELAENKSAIDEILIGGELKKHNTLDESGGYAYLASLTECVPSSGNVEHYANIVNEKHRLRQLITATANISEKSRDSESIADELIEEVLKAVEKIGSSGQKSKHSKLKDLITERAHAYDKFTDKNAPRDWIKTGFFDLDKIINGLIKKKLYIIAGRPSMGKTSLAINIILQSRKYHEYKGAIVFVSYEMSEEEIADRLITTDSKNNYNLLTRGKLGDGYDKLYQSMDSLSNLNVVVIDQMIPIEKLPGEFRKIEKEYGFIESIYIDYLQFAPAANTRQPREQQVASMARSLKQSAKDFNCPVVALSQLNRELEKRSDKRPMMSDIRESGEIEQTADVIAFIYRDEVYYDDSEDRGVAEINIAKQRSGPIGQAKLRFQEQFTRFDNLANRQ